nr:FHA domain-containing protein [Pseudomonas sp.]
MLELMVTQDDGSHVTYCLASPVVIGRGKDCDVPLRSWRVARHHARLYAHDHGVAVDDLGSLAGTLMNGQRIVHSGALAPEDEILIGGYRIRVRKLSGNEAVSMQQNRVEPQARPAAVQYESCRAPAPGGVSGHAVPDMAAGGEMQSAAPASLQKENASGIPAARRLRLSSDPSDTSGVGAPAHLPSLDAVHIEWRRRMYARLLEAIDLRR